MKSYRSFSVYIFVPSGDPDGLRIIEKFNWTGKALVFPRAILNEVRQHKELQQTGVYILWGPGESGQFPRVYVGQGDPVLSRLDQHAKDKDFWTHAAVFTSKDYSLNKAHVKYLEARLVALALEAKRAEIDNSNIPQLPDLSEADAADAEGFLADLLLCLPIVGLHVFDKAEVIGEPSKDLILKSKGIEAWGREETEGFVVRAGSKAVKEEVPLIPLYLSELRRELVEKGVLEDAGDFYRMTQDYIFASPSMAAGVLLGNSANGRDVWKDLKGRSLKELQEAGST